jgi:succinate dehydrogenase / fumarate reductase cytochrome b subunit
MLSSILHRVTGIGSTVGIFLLLWWLGALVSGPAAYDWFSWAMTSPIGWIVLVGVSWSIIAHTLSGIRHFVLDIGAGYELSANKFWATASTIAGIALTVIFWIAIILLHR